MSNVAPASNLTRTGAITGLAIQPRTLREQAERCVLLASEAVDLAHDRLDRVAADTGSTDEQFNAAVEDSRRAEAALEEQRFQLQLVLALSPEEQNAKRELVAAVTR